MKAFQISNRSAIFFVFQSFEWAGFNITRDYHNVIASVCILGLEVGFEYVWKNRYSPEQYPRTHFGGTWYKS